MEQIREYLISVTAAALLCAIAGKLVRKGSIAAVIKLMTGIFMTITVLHPILPFRVSDLELSVDRFRYEAQDAVSEGKLLALEAMERIISQQVTTYILDKAGSLGVELRVEVELTDGIPSAVTLEGDVPPYAKSVLREYIRDTLGILVEDQTWKE